MQVKYFGYGVIVIIFIVAVLSLSPEIYFYVKLPSVELLNDSKTVKAAFMGWSIENDDVILQSSQMPQTVFTCSLCYPHRQDSRNCDDRIASWIAKNLLAGKDSKNIAIHHIENYFLGKALERKYDSSVLLRLYLTLSGAGLGTTDVSQYCMQKFGKHCSELNPNEAIDFEIDIRKGQNKVSLQSLKSEISSQCSSLDGHKASY